VKSLLKKLSSIRCKNEKEIPVVIGVCGRSCSGKSRVVRKLEEYNKDYLRIAQDRFFKKKSACYEHPESLRNDRLIYSIKKLRKGDPTHIPSKGFTEEFDKKIYPKKIIIIEGFLLFSQKNLSDLFDLKIFVDVSDLGILYRRTKRDGTSAYMDYTMHTVIPESKRYDKIQKNRADIIIDGNRPKEEVMKDVDKVVKNFRKAIK